MKEIFKITEFENEVMGKGNSYQAKSKRYKHLTSYAKTPIKALRMLLDTIANPENR